MQIKIRLNKLRHVSMQIKINFPPILQCSSPNRMPVTPNLQIKSSIAKLYNIFYYIHGFLLHIQNY